MTPSTAIHLGHRSRLAILIVTIIGIFAFGWPLLADPSASILAHSADAPWLFALLVPILLLVVFAQLADGDMDAKSIAVLGVLAAVITALRPLSAGTAGIEPIWFILILGGRALGPGFGFALGSVGLFTSALVTGGIGPWLPFQMLGASWVGLGAGLLPRATGRREIFMTAAYGAAATFAYGVLMNLWLWPFASGLAPQIAFIPGAPLVENIQHWMLFSIATSMGWDLVRAVLSAVLILLTGRPILIALRRAARRASFGAAPEFAEAAVGTTP